MEEIGKYLKRARLDRRLSLSDIEQDTKISSRYLKALEEDNFDALPGRTYAIGFLRTYSKYLSLDDQHLVGILKEYYQKDEPAEDHFVMKSTAEIPVDPEAMSYVNKRKLQPWKVLVLVLLVGGLAVASVFYYVGTANQPENSQANDTPQTQTPSSGDQNTHTPSTQNPPSGNDTTVNPADTNTPPAEETPTEPGSTPATSTPQIQSLELLISADYGNCWIKVTADGKTTDFTLSKGGSRTITANEYITIKLGSAGAVRIILNGQDQPALGQIGDVVTTTYRTEQ